MNVLYCLVLSSLQKKVPAIRVKLSRVKTKKSELKCSTLSNPVLQF